VFVVAVVPRFSVNPVKVHLEADKRVYKYLKKTSNLWLTYNTSDDKLVGYADTNRSMGEDRHAISSL